MNNYTIFTDSGCDISEEKLKEWQVVKLDLKFRFQKEEREYINSEMTTDTFYARMKEGGVATTAALNPLEFEESFEKELKEGKDVLYLGFSSALSCTFANAKTAAAELLEKYPDRKIITVDTLAASAGQGLIVWEAVKAQREGVELGNLEGKIREKLPLLSLWFTVDNLVYLKRGGRIDGKTALVANVLGIKPVLHVDETGELTPEQKVRGRKAALRAIITKYAETAINPENGEVFISHADCKEDAQRLDSMLYDEYKRHATLLTEIGPVIGAHAGPGTIAMFYYGKKR